MGRYITPSDSGGGTMRTESHVLTASNAALAVPSWAKVAYITGSGGGMGGGNSLTGGAVGSGGQSAGGALRAPMLINGAATAAVVIGAAGAGAAAGSNLNGANGGDTTVTIGAGVITLRGGGTMNGVTNRADAFFGAAEAGGVSGYIGLYPESGSPVFVPGRPSPAGDSSRKGHGSHTPFGGGGIGVTGAVVTGQVGAHATGYGAGGSGGNGSGAGGNGSPGFVTIEFAESI